MVIAISNIHGEITDYEIDDIEHQEIVTYSKSKF